MWIAKTSFGFINIVMFQKNFRRKYAGAQLHAWQ